VDAIFYRLYLLLRNALDATGIHSENDSAGRYKSEFMALNSGTLCTNQRTNRVYHQRSHRMIVRTEAIVLRTMNYGETSQIVTLFTRERGKLSVLARGARVPKSRFGSTLQPGSYIQAVLYYKPTRDLQNLTETSHLRVFLYTAQELVRITLALRVVELTNALMQQEQYHPLVFNLLVQTLERLNDAGTHAGNLLPYFQIRLAAILGFSPSVDRESVQALPEEGGLLLLDTGSITGAGVAYNAWRRASRAALRAFAICARADLNDVMRMTLKPEVRTELDSLVEDYLRFHLEDAYPSRSAKIIQQIVS
jgi:DNA repair protein RecO (recombination protein O)